MKTVKKAIAVVVRPNKSATEVLVFRHPIAGIQIPKGTVEKNETIEAAVLRELKEESGIALDVKPKIIGKWNRKTKGGTNEDGPLEIHEWHIAILKPNTNLPEHWAHAPPAVPPKKA